MKRVNIVGAGLGGISAAIALASTGYSVKIFDKNSHIGGKLNILEKEGYKFDLGPSIMILPHIFRKLFEYTGRDMSDYFTITELSPQWRCFWEDGTVIDLHGDMKLMEKELDKYPEEIGYYDYINYSRNLWKFSEDAYFERRSDTLRDIAEGYSLPELARKTDYFSTMTQGVERFIKEPHLRDMMKFFIKYVGSSSDNAPAIMNLLAYSQLGYGEWYVEGGMYNIARGLRRLMDELGIEIHLETEIKEILIEMDKAVGVQTSDGTIYPSDYVISNMETIPAYKKLLPENRNLIRKYEKTFEPSCSGLVLDLGIDRRYENLAHHNFIFSKDQSGHFDSVYNKKKMPDDPTIYLVAPTRTDPTVAPPGCDVIKILPHIPHIQNPPYEKKDYDALRERVLDKLERTVMPDLRKHIVVEDMLIPDDIERMYYSNKGSIYGIVSDRRKNKGLRTPKKSEIYENLYFVGGSVNPGSGMPMVISSGQMVRDMIIEKER